MELTNRVCLVTGGAQGIGCLDGQWAYTIASTWTRLGKAEMHVGEWSERFPYRPEKEPVVSFVANLRMKAPSPKLIGQS